MTEEQFKEYVKRFPIFDVPADTDPTHVLYTVTCFPEDPKLRFDIKFSWSGHPKLKLPWGQEYGLSAIYALELITGHRVFFNDLSGNQQESQ